MLLLVIYIHIYIYISGENRWTYYDGLAHNSMYLEMGFETLRLSFCEYNLLIIRSTNRPYETD